jgi:hypothetical protein
MYELLTAVANATYITRLDMKNVFNLVWMENGDE